MWLRLLMSAFHYKVKSLFRWGFAKVVVSSSCRTTLPSSSTGASNLKGQEIELTVDRIPCLVHSPSLNKITNMKLFDVIHHCTPKACSIGKVSQWNSRFLTSSTLSISGIFSITSPLLDVNLHTLNATLAHPFNALNKCNCLFN